MGDQARDIHNIFGLDAGYKVQLDNDPQLQKAIESLPQAKALYATARKIVAQRENSGDIGNPNP